MSESVNVVSGKEYGEVAKEGDIIKVAQYDNALRVNFVSDVMVGVEFSDVSQRNSTPKHLMINAHSGRLYLVAGQSDKGEVEFVTVVARSA
jgi:hypothetical protein